MKSKIAFVVQRYGVEINGGAEQHCRLLAEKLSAIYDVEVLTTCCESYITWENCFPPGKSQLNGVTVIRFRTNTIKSTNRSTYRFLRRRKGFQKVGKALGILNIVEEQFPSLKPSISDFANWVNEQGPYTPDLIKWLTSNKDSYKAVIFFTYLYFPTIMGLEVCPEKSILIPTAHDENPIHIPFFKRIFNLPRVIIYNTSFEKKFVNNLYNNNHIKSAIAGVGIEPVTSKRSIDVKEIFNITKKYLLYVGRIEAGKGCKTLIEYFNKYNNHNGQSLQLVMVGQQLMTIPENAAIIKTGFISDELKNELIQQAEILLMPSKYESLSMVTLEAMKLKVPVVVNGACQVLEDHIINSKAGLSYFNYQSFKLALDTILFNKELKINMGLMGEEYVQRHYTWDNIIQTFVSNIDSL